MNNSLISSLLEEYDHCRKKIPTDLSDENLTKDENFVKCLSINYLLSKIQLDSTHAEVAEVCFSADGYDISLFLNRFGVIWNDNSYTINFNDKTA